jgi:hypothetical protein
MARGRHDDRSKTSARDTAGGGTGRDELSRYEPVEFEEVDEPGGAGGVRARTSPAPRADDVAADRMRNNAMSQPEDTSRARLGMAESTSSPDPAVAPPPRRRGGTGFLAGLIGGLLGTGAVLGGGGWYAYEHGPVKPAVDRFAAVESSARNAESGVGRVGDQVGQLRGDIDGLRTTLQGTSADLQKTNEAVAALSERVAASEKATADLAAASEKASADLRATVEQASTSFRKASEEVIGRLEAVNAKLVEVEQGQPADIVDKGTVAAVQQKQTTIDENQARLDGALSRLEQLVAQGLAAGNQQAAAVQTAVDSSRARMEEIATGQKELMTLKDQVTQHGEQLTRSQTASEQLGQQIAAVRSDLEQKLGDMASRLTALDAARERSVGMSIAVHDVETAIQDGSPFQPALETLAQLSQDDEVVRGAVERLQPVAESGVVGLAELRQRLGAIAQGLQPTAKEQPSDWLDWTRQNLQGLVDVHAQGEESVPGMNAVQTAGRALEGEDLQNSIAALEPLAQQGNQDAAAWIDAAQKRIAAREALETLQQHVKTMLAQQG